jgi:hypothetical protein
MQYSELHMQPSANAHEYRRGNSHHKASFIHLLVTTDTWEGMEEAKLEKVRIWWMEEMQRKSASEITFAPGASLYPALRLFNVLELGFALMALELSPPERKAMAEWAGYGDAHQIHVEYRYELWQAYHFGVNLNCMFACMVGIQSVGGIEFVLDSREWLTLQFNPQEVLARHRRDAEQNHREAAEAYEI